MNCVQCAYRYIGGGWTCWSGNKLTLARCNNGNPSKDRVIYRRGITTTEVKKDGDGDG